MNYLKEYKQKELEKVSRYLTGKRVRGIAFTDKHWRYVLEDGTMIEREIVSRYSNKKLVEFSKEVEDKKIKRVTIREDLITVVLENNVPISGYMDIDFVLSNIL